MNALLGILRDTSTQDIGKSTPPHSNEYRPVQEQCLHILEIVRLPNGPSQQSDH